MARPIALTAIWNCPFWTCQLSQLRLSVLDDLRMQRARANALQFNTHCTLFPRVSPPMGLSDQLRTGPESSSAKYPVPAAVYGPKGIQFSPGAVVPQLACPFGPWGPPA